MTLAARVPLYASLLRLDKPIGTLLLLWPTLTALWIASDGVPSAVHLLVFALGTFLMRSAGCAINDATDFRFDAQVKRTEVRVVARGLLHPGEAVAVAIVVAAMAGMLLLLLNLAAFRLALVALVIAATYPLFKRFFPVPQLYLGIAFSFGIPMAFAAVQGVVPPVGWLLFLANLFWVVAYDTQYAMIDRDDDLRLGIHSSAIFFGRADVAAVMACYGAFLSLLLLVGHALHADWPFYLGCFFAFVWTLREWHLTRSRTREACFRAFRDNQWIGLAVFAGVVANYALR
ncbi:MAG: 4-hydroxybenzoate octaprenyltransferase [Burkholderiaceae bacterium]